MLLLLYYSRVQLRRFPHLSLAFPSRFVKPTNEMFPMVKGKFLRFLYFSLKSSGRRHLGHVKMPPRFRTCVSILRVATLFPFLFFSLSLFFMSVLLVVLSVFPFQSARYWCSENRSWCSIARFNGCHKSIRMAECCASILFPLHIYFVT